MTEANDNLTPKDRFRSALRDSWPQAGSPEFLTSESLVRISEARAASSKSANRFMLMAAAFAALYFLRIQGIAQDVEVSGKALRDIPFALFVFTSGALVASTLSFLRAGDSRAFDRLLRFACEKKDGTDIGFSYLSFANESAWGHPFSQMVSKINLTGFGLFMQRVALTTVSSFMIALLLSPLAIAFDYMMNSRYITEAGLAPFRIGLVAFLTFSNVTLFLLLNWSQFADRD